MRAIAQQLERPLIARLALRSICGISSMWTRDSHREFFEIEQGNPDMDEMTFQQKMQELMARIGEIPDATELTQDNASTSNPAETRRERIKASVSELQESLDYLRLSVKYLVFDLEATRRENRYLRRMLDQSNRDAQKRFEDDNEDRGEF